MIYVLSGGQTGATLTVTSSDAGTITVSNTTLKKSYSKSVTAGGSEVFKGLQTGTWTIKLTDGSKTSTKNITITSDYSTSIAYFSATISITYPAKSTCVVKNKSGQTVASNSNTGSSTKTWTATVGATGTYTVTATATDGSGKSKSTTVDITTDGQSKSVTLKYSLDIIVNGKFNYDVIGSWVASSDSSGLGSLTEKNGYVEIYAPVSTYTDWASRKALPTSEYSTMYVDYDATLNGYSSQFISLGGVSVDTNSDSYDARNTRAVDISGLTADYQMVLIARAWAGNGGVTIRIYNLYFE